MQHWQFNLQLTQTSSPLAVKLFINYLSFSFLRAKATTAFSAS